MTAVVSAPPRQAAQRESGYWRTAWYEFRHNRLAMRRPGHRRPAGRQRGLRAADRAVSAERAARERADRRRATRGRRAAQFLLGTDTLGRDELSRLLFGARISLTVGLGSALIGGLLGLALGGVAGLFGGLVDKLLMRLADVDPQLPDPAARDRHPGRDPGRRAARSASSSASASAPTSARVVYAQAVTLRERDFVLAARTSAGGARPHPAAPHRAPRHAEHHRVLHARRGDRDPARGGAELCGPRASTPHRVAGAT